MNKNYPFTACIFDLDGTLVDSLPGISYAVDLAIAAVVPEIPRKDLRALIGPPIRRVFQSALCGVASEAQLDSLEESFRQAYDSEGWKQSKPFEGVAQTLQNLVSIDVSLFVLTNKPLHVAGRILALCGLDECFRAVIGPESGRPPFSSKPRAAEHLCRRFGLFGQRTLLIGDSEDDARSARHCGLSFAAADYGYGQVTTKLPGSFDYRLTSFSDLLMVG